MKKELDETREKCRGAEDEKDWAQSFLGIETDKVGPHQEIDIADLEEIRDAVQKDLGREDRGPGEREASRGKSPGDRETSRGKRQRSSRSVTMTKRTSLHAEAASGRP